ncbi:MAG: sulfotransferase, partial [Gammaproteobacteria bacterium]
MKAQRRNARGWLHRGLDLLAWPFSRRRLRPGELIDTALQRTGLRDFGPEGPHEQALGVLCEALEHEAALSPLGRLLARQTLVSALDVQLKLTAALNARPALLDVPIERPFVVIGMPRTGTTILHELLALDPANRCPLSWEVAKPFPDADTRDAKAADPRIAATAREFAFSERLMPGLQSMHRIGATLPQECVGITAFAFSSMQYPTIWRVPSYQRWLQRDCEHGPVYAFHRRFLQYLQGGRAGLRWVLK